MTGKGLLAAAMVFGLAGLATAPAYAEDWDQVVAAAKKEGSVALYTGDVASKCGPARSKAFEAKYGIEVKTLSARGSEVDARVVAEQTSGRFVGDVYANGYNPAYLFEQDDRLAAHGDLPNLAHQPAAYKLDEKIVASQVLLYGFMTNTSELSEAEQPKSWHDLLKPAFKGKLLADQMNVPGGGMLGFQVFYQSFGKEFVDQLAAQQISFDRDVGKDARRIAQGEYLVYMPVSSLFSVTGLGLPIKFVLPTEGVPTLFNTVSVLKNAPHPNAARLLVNYYLDPEWQAACANEGSGVVVDNVDTAKLNDFAKAIKAEKSLGTAALGLDIQNKWIATAKGYFP